MVALSLWDKKGTTLVIRPVLIGSTRLEAPLNLRYDNTA